MRLCICDWCDGSRWETEDEPCHECGGSGLAEAESAPGWAVYEDDGEVD